jgi:hypothetical protein
MTQSGDSRAQQRQQFVVDRLEGSHAVLEGAPDQAISIQCSVVPFKLSEGLVLVVPIINGAFDWSASKADHDETRRRLKEASQRMENLRAADPGGDIKL